MRNVLILTKDDTDISYLTSATNTNELEIQAYGTGTLSLNSTVVANFINDINTYKVPKDYIYPNSTDPRTIGTLKITFAGREIEVKCHGFADTDDIFLNYESGVLRLTHTDAYQLIRWSEDRHSIGIGMDAHPTSQLVMAVSPEIYGPTPYIDFHYNNDSGDYTHRLIADNPTHLRSSTPIKYKGMGSSWVNGRDCAFIKTADTPTTTTYVPILSSKSNTGSWEQGVYQDDVYYLTHISDANYNAGQNTCTAQFRFYKDGRIVTPILDINGTRYHSYGLVSPTHTSSSIWVCLGELSGTTDSQNTYIKVFTGNGYNSRVDQNTILNIHIKDGWQEANKGRYDAFGVTWTCEGRFDPKIQVKFQTTGTNTGRLFLLLPWTYRDGYYNVETRGTWKNIMTESTSAPSIGIDQAVKFMGGGDTDWVNVGVGTDVGVYETGMDTRVRRSGNIVFFSGQLKKTTGTQPATLDRNYLLFTIPEGYRPSRDANFVIQGSQMNRALLRVNANGNVYICRYGTTTSSDITVGVWLTFDVMYFTN